MSKNLKKILQSFSELSGREKFLIAAAACGLFLFIGHSGVSTLKESLASKKRLQIVRERELQDINFLLERHSFLSGKLDGIQKSFQEAQMTFEEVTKEIDSIVKKSLGDKSDYDLKKPRSPSQLGLNFEKQEFSLKVKAAELEQLVKLLFSLEQGESPLFLGKIDLRRSAKSDLFTLTLELFSVREQRA